ncbi:hypothetical protein WA1_01860 [Scytonema hofmannii PCC 7110]|uniref:Uncharacterized protein n=1 Tax=Scytonema hofmannii PCC 7110 TaxID=128403 RepID=A0A139XH30_9CYAN|nr:hypothetical protein [Scytonema hofmannii]KYC43922.1 hypothetical protein WA1_01860 [Scytonema hofmannii PCC 7110]
MPDRVESSAEAPFIYRSHAKNGNCYFYSCAIIYVIKKNKGDILAIQKQDIKLVTINALLILLGKVGLVGYFNKSLIILLRSYKILFNSVSELEASPSSLLNHGNLIIKCHRNIKYRGEQSIILSNLTLTNQVRY